MTDDHDPDTPASGVRIGVDVGTVRVGVAASDPGGILATPVTTLQRDPDHHRDIEELALIIVERQAVEVAVGLPRTLKGRDSTSTADARRYAAQLGDRVAPVPVVLVDERLTSVQANRVLTQQRVPARSRRSVVDQIAAVEILQNRLDVVRALRRGHG